MFLIFALYVILLSLIVARHEPWLDEAQPWLYATDFRLGELLGKHLRYEGHPALWYVILFIPAKLGLPYQSVNVVAALAAFGAQWIFLRYAPFPPIIKILLPFSFFAFYQYAVVARGYALIPLLLFLIAVNYHAKIERPFLYAGLLCLFANVSVHAFLIAGMLMLLHFGDVVKIWSKLEKGAKIRQIGAALLFALSSLQIIFVLLPPADQGFAVGANWDWRNFYDVSRKMLGGSLVADETTPLRWLPDILTAATLAATLILLRERRLTLLYILPLSVVLGLLAVKYSNVWHEGILFFLWIFVLWIRFADRRDEVPSNPGKIVLALLTIVLAVQVYWAFAAARADFYHPYSGSRQAARYIRDNRLENGKIYVSGWKTVALAPYFDRKIFYNLNQNSDLRIWRWSTENRTPVGFDQNIIASIRREQPETVVIASDHLENIPPAEFENYRLAAFFEGNLYWKAGTFEPDSYWIFRRTDASP